MARANRMKAFIKRHESLRRFALWLLARRFWLRSPSIRRKANQDLLAELILRLRPITNGHELIRLGGASDGGYLVPDDLDGIAKCFSPGSGGNWGFERALLNRYAISSEICDRESSRPTDLDQGVGFTDAWLGSITEPGFVSLQEWMTSAPADQDLLLQMDIEGAEWHVLPAVDRNELRRFRIMLIEFHNLHWLQNQAFLENLAKPLFLRLLQDFDIVHVHPNNNGILWRGAGFRFPSLAEFTFHRKDRAKSYLGPSQLPHPQDRNNVPYRRSQQIQWPMAQVN